MSGSKIKTLNDFYDALCEVEKNGRDCYKKKCNTSFLEYYRISRNVNTFKPIIRISMNEVNQFDISYRCGRGYLIFIFVSFFSIVAFWLILLYNNQFSIIGVVLPLFFYILFEVTLYFFFEEECFRFQKYLKKLGCQLISQEKKWIWW